MKKTILFSVVSVIVAFFVVGGTHLFASEAWDGTTTMEPQKNEAGAYLISNGAELAWVAQESNKAAMATALVLTADIDLGGQTWTPIGQNEYFNGDIDGQGHKISGLHLVQKASDVCIGLIGKTNGSKQVIRDLTIEGDLTIGEVYSGKQADYASLIGLANACKTIENVQSYVDITMSGKANYMGGLIGRGKANNLNKCVYGGTLKILEGATFNKGWGGIIGTFNSGTSGATGSMTNCAMTGKLIKEATGTIVYNASLAGFPSLTAGTCTIENNYALSDFPAMCNPNATTVYANNYTFAAEDSYSTTITEEQVHSGELCWLLNNGSEGSEGSDGNFTQDLSDATSVPMPVEGKKVNKITFLADSAEFAAEYVNDKVAFPAVNPEKTDYYFVGWFDAAEGGKQYQADDAIEADLTLYAHFEMALDVWDGTTTIEPQKNSAGAYLINNGAELAWVAQLSKDSIITDAIIIEKNIDLGGHAWTPIGLSKAFNGNVVGQGHTVRNLYVECGASDKYCGFIGYVKSDDMTISDLTLEGRMVVAQGSADIGSLIGKSDAIGRIVNCHSNVDIEFSSATGDYMGGLVGFMKAGDIDRCSYSGNITLAAVSTGLKGVAGIVGTYNTTAGTPVANLQNTVFCGRISSEVTSEMTYVGGLVGYANLKGKGEGMLTLTSNYINAAIDITGTAPKYAPANGGVLFAKCTAGNTSYSNNYLVEVNGLTADTKHTTATTTEQLHSGELCWMLNSVPEPVEGQNSQNSQNWTQDLSDTESVPMPVEGKTVYSVEFMVSEPTDSIDSLYAHSFTNDVIAFPETPAKEGYDFVGWFDNADKQYQEGDQTSADLTLYAKFENHDPNKLVKILAIGNSFTVDAVEDYLAPIAHSVGRDVVIGYPYKGGTTLEQHMGYINSDNAIYNYRKIEAGKDVYESKGTVVMKTAIQDEDWDYVIIQTDHNYSGVYDHYFPYLTDLISYVKQNISNPNAKFIMYMTWAYDEGSSYSAFSLYNNDQTTMYNAIVDAAPRAAEEAGIDVIIPTGTAIQNCRTSYIGQNMNRDGYHLNYDHGRYVAGLSWAKTVLGIEPDSVTYHPTSISDNKAQVCKDAVSWAFSTPFAVTSMAEKWGTDPDAPERPEMPEVWDGSMTVEPLKDSVGWYVITNPAELAWIAQAASAATFAYNITIENDLDLGSHKWTPIGNSSAYFNGSVKGNGHTIRNLYLAPEAADVCTGLIGATNSTGYIENLNLEGKIEFLQQSTGSNMDAGSFVGLANALSRMENCHSSVDIIGNDGFGLYTGGLCGRAKAVSFKDCSYSGNMTIGSTSSKAKGWAGLVGTFNSSVSGAEGGMEGCWFDGTITSTTSGAMTYGAALVGYANLSAGACTLDRNYINGSITITGTTPTNYGMVYGKAAKTTTVSNIYIVDGTDSQATTVTAEQLHNGELCWMLNSVPEPVEGQNLQLFSQDLSKEDSHPVVFVDSIAVFKATYMTNDTVYTATYNNQMLRLPADPVMDGYDFAGWFDAAEGGNQYVAGAAINSDLTLYAHFQQATGINEVSDFMIQNSGAAYNLNGVRVDGSYKGVVIMNGKKYIAR